MYSNDYNQIKSGLKNYIHSLCKTCVFKEERANKQFVIATLLELALDLSKENDKDEIDLFAVKPILRATKVIMQDRITQLKELKPTAQIKLRIENYENNIKDLDELVNLIN